MNREDAAAATDAEMKAAVGVFNEERAKRVLSPSTSDAEPPRAKRPDQSAGSAGDVANAGVGTGGTGVPTATPLTMEDMAKLFDLKLAPVTSSIAKLEQDFGSLNITVKSLESKIQKIPNI